MKNLKVKRKISMKKCKTLKYTMLLAMFVATAFMVFFISSKALAAPADVPIPKVNFSVDGAANTTQSYVSNIRLLIALTILTLLPSFIIMMTSFVRIIVVFGFLRNAIGTQQSPPNQVLIGLALFLTIFIMTPVYSDVNKNAIQPFLQRSEDTR